MGTQSDRAISRMQDALAHEGDAPVTRAEQFTMFKGKVEAILPAVASAMPRHVQPDRILRTVMTAVRTTPQLLDCTIDSLLAGTLVAAQLGLEIGPLGHAYLVPYKRNKKVGGDWKTWHEATFIVGYRGMLDLARRSGNIESIYAYPVYEGDKFEFELGMHPRLRHVPSTAEPNEDSITHFYAVAHLVGGGEQFEVMTRAQVDTVMRRSKGSGNATQDAEGVWRAEYGPWQTDYSEMGRKTVMRRLFKWLPVSVEAQKAVAADETVRHGVAPDMLELPDVSEADDVFEGVVLDTPEPEKTASAETGQTVYEAFIVDAEPEEPVSHEQDSEARIEQEDFFTMGVQSEATGDDTQDVVVEPKSATRRKPVDK